MIAFILRSILLIFCNISIDLAPVNLIFPTSLQKSQNRNDSTRYVEEMQSKMVNVAWIHIK
ncbi:hypothetical protein HMPREF2674_05535 [Rothia sp. HMSC062F03]|nr:hypothetical protein HMPREF2674_05535 [Rothia sp. HMSC062F03]